MSFETRYDKSVSLDSQFDKSNNNNNTSLVSNQRHKLVVLPFTVQKFFSLVLEKSRKLGSHRLQAHNFKTQVASFHI